MHWPCLPSQFFQNVLVLWYKYANFLFLLAKIILPASNFYLQNMAFWLRFRTKNTELHYSKKFPFSASSVFYLFLLSVYHGKLFFTRKTGDISPVFCCKGYCSWNTYSKNCNYQSCITAFKSIWIISQNDILKFFAARSVTFKNTLVTVPMKSFSLPLLAGSIWFVWSAWLVWLGSFASSSV